MQGPGQSEMHEMSGATSNQLGLLVRCKIWRIEAAGTSNMDIGWLVVAASGETGHSALALVDGCVPQIPTAISVRKIDFFTKSCLPTWEGRKKEGEVRSP